MTQPDSLIVFYNENCAVCRAEIAHYRSYAQSQRLDIVFEDLNTADLTPLGLTPQEAARRLYVVEAGGIKGGIDGFLLLWAAMPRYRWLARVAGAPVLRQVAEILYERILAPWIYARHLKREAARAALR